MDAYPDMRRTAAELAGQVPALLSFACEHRARSRHRAAADGFGARAKDVWPRASTAEIGARPTDSPPARPDGRGPRAETVRRGAAWFGDRARSDSFTRRENRALHRSP